MVALDGQQFVEQSAETQAAFHHHYGLHAEDHWEFEHESALPATDGLRFGDQSPDTRAAFAAAFGYAAARQWIAEHNEALRPAPDPHWEVVEVEADEGDSRYGALVLAYWPRWSGVIDGIRYHDSPVIKAQTSRQKGEIGYWFVGWLADRGYEFPVGSAWIMRVDGFCRVYEAEQTDPESALRFVEYAWSDDTAGLDDQVAGVQGEKADDSNE